MSSLFDQLLYISEMTERAKESDLSESDGSISSESEEFSPSKHFKRSCVLEEQDEEKAGIGFVALRKSERNVSLHAYVCPSVGRKDLSTIVFLLFHQQNGKKQN